MMEWFILVLVAFLYSISVYISYNEQIRQSNWYIPSSGFIGLIGGVLWASMVKWLDEKEKIYFYSLAWDTIIVAVFYFLPFFFGIKLSVNGIIGITLMTIGLILIKLS